jgi:dGTPase
MKYPKESLPKKPTNHIADKKYGVFQSEKDAFLEVTKNLKLNPVLKGNDVSFSRHPLAFLVEAADDICYTIIDFEDGINLGLIQEEFALEYLINLVRSTIDVKKYNALKNTQDRVSYLRALTINALINEAVDVFMKNEEIILNGKFGHALLDKCKYEAQINDIIKLSIKNIYQSKEVIEKEISGFEVINTLLKTFCRAVNNEFNKKASSYDKLILRILPDTIDFQSNDLYTRLINICHYIALLSDRNAILIYKKIKGFTIN